MKWKLFRLMKEIKAYIRRKSMDAVVNALAHIKELSGVSLSTVTGFGRSRGRLRFVDFETHVKVEVVCQDPLVGQVIDAIEKAGCTGHRGDGKIFVSNVEQAVRIETGVRGEVCV